MRLGNAEDAKAASEQIGTEHRFVLSQLTDTIGTSVTDTTGVSYTSTVGDSASVSASSSDSESRSASSGRSSSAESSLLPFGGGRTRSGETGEASELQRLPPTAMIVSYATAEGRQVLLADANPAIGGLSVATMAPFVEADMYGDTAPAEPPMPGRTPGEPPPNIGPPSARLDWRKR
jgi:hypothetical protein